MQVQRSLNSSVADRGMQQCLPHPSMLASVVRVDVENVNDIPWDRWFLSPHQRSAKTTSLFTKTGSRGSSIASGTTGWDACVHIPLTVKKPPSVIAGSGIGELACTLPLLSQIVCR